MSLGCSRCLKVDPTTRFVWAIEVMTSVPLCMFCVWERQHGFELFVFREQSRSWFKRRARFELAWWNACYAWRLIAYVPPE